MARKKKSGRRELCAERLEARIVFTTELVSDLLTVASCEASGVMADADLAQNAQAYFAQSPDSVWESRPQVPATQGLVSYIQPSSFSAAVLDAPALFSRLASAPMEFSAEAVSSPLQISLPTPDHRYARFSVVQSPIMESALAAQFPDIMTYSGQGIDDPAATLRFDVTPAGFHAQVLSPNGTYYIDPYWHLDQSIYVSYYKRDLAPRAGMEFDEELFDEHNAVTKSKASDEAIPELQFSKGGQDGTVVNAKGDGNTTLSRSGTQLKTYRLANAATAEYTAFHGGTVSLGQAAIVTAINRVTGIYENELSIRMVLVANNSSLVYTNAATDPYTNGNPSSLLSQNQANIDSVIGNANYDIGHVFSTGGGGLAGLGVVGVSGQKARGETGLTQPVGDAFYVDYVAHEMGHQFGGNHTFNGVTGSCSGGNRNGGTAYEPGSGTTIQAYAGICGADDLQAHSDPYFHSVSFDEITAYTSTGAGNTAATISTTGNSVPRVNAGSDYSIPARTPFALNAGGTDADTGDVLTYNWEERDLGVGLLVSAADNGTSPIFRSFNPTISPERVLPRLTELLNNTTVTGEKLPTTTRSLKFRATVRDNRAGGGGLNTDDMQVSVVDTGSAFSLLSPNTPLTWAGSSAQAISWNVAGTTATPISAANVNIWLSTDGGTSFPILLASNTPNDGSENIVVPDLSTASARIKVEAADNIFFDVSNSNFTIVGGSNTPPSVSQVLNRLIDSNTNTGPIAFTIADEQTAASDLIVSAKSSNAALVSASGIVLAGAGANRTISVTPTPGQFGQAAISILVTDASGLQVEEAFQLFVEGIVACAPYEDFDSLTVPTLPVGWATSATGSTPTNWVTSSAGSSSAPNNIFVSNPTNISDSRLTTPIIAVTQANNQFKFRNNYNLESTYDGGVIEISVDGGPFVDLLIAGGSFKSGGYNSAIDSTSASPLAGRPAWTGSSGGYIDTVAEFPTSAIGKNVQLRLRMGSDDSVAATGWRLDSTQTCGAPLPPANSTIATRGLFYGNATGTSASTSLATDKSALLPGQSSTFANYTNYSRGINGIVVDITGLPSTTTNSDMTASLEFANWNGIDSAGFIALPSEAIPTVNILPGEVSGASRVQITFPDNTLQNTWLRVTVLANPSTTLAANDVFYFGNVVADFNVGNLSNSIRVNAADSSAIRRNQSTGADTAPVTNIFDVNRDGRVNAQDTSIVRNNQQTGGIVAPINAPPAKSPARSRFGTSSSQSNSLPVGLADLKDNDDTTEKDNSGLKIVDDFFATL